MNFWRSFGVVTHSLLLEKVLEDSWRLKEEKDKLFSNLHCYHHSLLKVGFLACILFSPCLIMLVLAYSVVLLFFACLYVGLIWRVLFCVVLGRFLVYLDVLY